MINNNGTLNANCCCLLFFTHPRFVPISNTSINSEYSVIIRLRYENGESGMYVIENDVYENSMSGMQMVRVCVKKQKE